MSRKPYILAVKISGASEIRKKLNLPEEGKLRVSEIFYSVQCEGKTAGVPSLFIRLQGCNLTCGFSPEHTKEIYKSGPGQQIPGDIRGDLHQKGQATWSCDTLPVWLFGSAKSNFEVLSEIKILGIKQNFDFLQYLRDQRIHIIFTGGEPLMKQHQKDIMNFLIWLWDNYNIEPYVEIETNGTLEPLPTGGAFISLDKEEQNFYTSFIDQINCSPKLANSGMPIQKRINPQALEKVLRHPNGYFKFVVSSNTDIKEIEEDFVIPLNVSPDKILLMPGLDAQEDFHERCRFLLELSKETGYRCMPRLHISAWDKTTGV